MEIHVVDHTTQRSEPAHNGQHTRRAPHATNHSNVANPKMDIDRAHDDAGWPQATYALPRATLHPSFNAPTAAG